MHQIEGLTEEQIIEAINEVASYHTGKTFSYYEEDDIKQEIWIIALNAIAKFDPSKLNEEKNTDRDLKTALVFWLNKIIKNRLINLHRDKFVVPQKALKSDKSDYDRQKRQNLMHPLNINEVSEDHFSINDISEKTEQTEKLISELDNYHYDILETILSGQQVNCYYRKKLIKRLESLWQQKVD